MAAACAWKWSCSYEVMDAILGHVPGNFHVSNTLITVLVQLCYVLLWYLSAF